MGGAVASLTRHIAEVFTPERLTYILHRRGHLDTGAIIALTPTQMLESPTAYVLLLEASYSADASGDVPARLALKYYKPGCSPELISREIGFYTTLAPSVRRLPVVRCYAAEHDLVTGIAFCLLEDCTVTHRSGTLVASASPAQLRMVTNALARLHAAFWNHSDIVQTLLPDTVASFVDDFTYHAQRLTELSAVLKDRLPLEWQTMLRTFIDHGEDVLLGRLASRRTLTLVHSDPHFGNVLFPRDEHTDQPLLIDFAFVRAWWGARDVAFMLTFASDPAQRRAVEPGLIQHYHAQLLQYGVRDYSWDECWHDYRLGVITNLRTPLGNRKQPYVWYRLERAIQAYRDLACEELLA